ncbi:MAG: TIGR03032 family protein, partial [Zavarzinella sp.]|nr:TIGR03032 family protein [Zavarzinella sp.]
PGAGGAEQGFTSVHTRNFPALLQRLNLSLAVSTYQAGKLILVRADGDELNTHFRQFASPMGVALDAQTRALAVGTRHQIWTFRDHPAVAQTLDPPGENDAVFLPRHTHFSGDIRVHEIGWVGRELWAVNTRFSCMCTFDPESNFVPRWRPPFITAYAAEDRCHLNGMAVKDGRVGLVTFLAQTDTPGGWRAHKADGGCLWDVGNDCLVAAGLCMPHSPRYHDGKVWLLESGVGALCLVDEAAGRTTEVVRLPGFTRGLAFVGPYAFVGLSQVRESAIFGGIPIAAEGQSRACGVWVVDLRTGTVVAFLRFEGAVQEIFAVEVLPDIRFPELINEPGESLDSSFVLPPTVR